MLIVAGIWHGPIGLAGLAQDVHVVLVYRPEASRTSPVVPPAER
jgi:hypothetical protein